jgi:dephospho-CoA kinase
VSYLVGLTGGIGSGKSEVAKIFARLGAEVLDADDVAHALSRPGAAGHRAMVSEFGPECLQADGAIDRAWLRDRAFADAAFRDRLERVLHPLIASAIDEAVREWRTVYGILVVPLLLERGRLSSRVARVLVIDCPEELQLQRAAARSGLTHDAIRAIMATQLSRDARLARADDVIDNSGAKSALRPQVERFDSRYRALATAAAP